MIKQLAIKLHLWKEKGVTVTFVGGTARISTHPDDVLVNKGWYEIAMKHYCGICEQWFKTASVASHNRFKHKDA